MVGTWFGKLRQLGGPRAYALYALLLAVLFAWPLASLASYAATTDLHSHILLVPVVSGYLLYVRRRMLPTAKAHSISGAAVSAAVGVAALAAAIEWQHGLSVNDWLALMALAFVSFVAAGGFLFCGTAWMARAAFPMAFLVFMVPLPDVAVDWLERASVLASANAAWLYFTATGTPVVRHASVFELPGTVLQVSQECSGIRSSWVLFITSLLASHLFLRSPWRKLLLVAFVIPLGVLRNAFRILVIGLLCVHVSPQMIESPIHRRGGPLFFALSLIPLFLLSWWLRRQEMPAAYRPR